MKSLTFWGFEKWEEWIGIGEEEEEDNGFVTNTIIIMPHLHSLTIEILNKGFSINRITFEIGYSLRLQPYLIKLILLHILKI